MPQKAPQDKRDSDAETGEATPLLAKDDDVVVKRCTTDEEQGSAAPTTTVPSSVGGGYLGSAPSAPPPAAPPPPLPASPLDDDEEEVATSSDKKKNNGKGGGGEGKKKKERAPSLKEGEDDEDERSLTRSTKSGKSGKSGKSSRKKKKKGGGGDDQDDAASKKKGDAASKKKKEKEGPQKSVFHIAFDFVRYLAIIASTLMLTMQVVPLILLEKDSTWLQIAVRCYLAIFCLSFILAEARIPLLRRVAFPQDNWILRGFLYSFVGLIGMEQDLAVRIEDIAAGTSSVLGPDLGTLFAALFMSVTTWIMMGVGALYAMLGMLCMQGWYEKMEKDHSEKVKEWKREKKREKEFKRQQEEYRRYEEDRREGRGEWYDDM